MRKYIVPSPLNDLQCSALPGKYSYKLWMNLKRKQMKEETREWKNGNGGF